MVTGRLGQFSRDKAGAALLEFTVVIGVLLSLLFGVIEFSLAFAQWNAATKALQVGARLASVSYPVWQPLQPPPGSGGGGNGGPHDGPLSGIESATYVVGDPLNYTYSASCIGDAGGASGTCTVSTTGEAIADTFNVVAMRTLLYGRYDPDNPPALVCGETINTGVGMCDIFDDIGFDNVQIEYFHTNMGYVTRPGGLVPTIRLSLVGVTFNFVFLDDLFGIGPITMPGLVTTISGEDLNGRAPAF